MLSDEAILDIHTKEDLEEVILSTAFSNGRWKHSDEREIKTGNMEYRHIIESDLINLKNIEDYESFGERETYIKLEL